LKDINIKELGKERTQEFPIRIPKAPSEFHPWGHPLGTPAKSSNFSFQTTALALIVTPIEYYEYFPAWVWGKAQTQPVI